MAESSEPTVGEERVHVTFSQNAPLAYSGFLVLDFNYGLVPELEKRLKLETRKFCTFILLT